MSIVSVIACMASMACATVAPGQNIVDEPSCAHDSAQQWSILSLLCGCKSQAQWSAVMKELGTECSKGGPEGWVLLQI